MVRAGHALYGYVSPAKGDAPAELLSELERLSPKYNVLWSVVGAEEDNFASFGADADVFQQAA